MHRSTVLNCSHKTTAILFILIGSLFIFIGCEQLYKMIGLTKEQTALQVAQDQEAVQQIIQQVRWTTHEIITTALAGAGAIASGFLAKWLGTEKKITKVMITGIEKAPNNNVKESIKTEALSAGVEPKLNARVKSLT